MCCCGSSPTSVGSSSETTSLSTPIDDKDIREVGELLWHHSPSDRDNKLGDHVSCWLDFRWFGGFLVAGAAWGHIHVEISILDVDGASPPHCAPFRGGSDSEPQW